MQYTLKSDKNKLYWHTF